MQVNFTNPLEWEFVFTESGGVRLAVSAYSVASTPCLAKKYIYFAKKRRISRRDRRSHLSAGGHGNLPLRIKSFLLRRVLSASAAKWFGFYFINSRQNAA
ncbi:MAG: hypothetical protein ACI4K9_03335, partial [Candidatus Fimenecus sp.]